MRFAAAAIGLTALMCRTAPLAAQAGASTDIVRGTVTDTTGEPLANVTVSVRSLETNVTKTGTTDARGRYMVVFVDAGGRYLVTARAIGYRPVSMNVSRLADEDVLVGNLRLGGVPVQLAEINVRSSTPPPAGQDPGAAVSVIPGVIASRLPIDGRDPTDLVAFSNNTVATPSGSTDSSESQNSFAIAGARTGLNRITLDGLTLGSALTGGRAGGGAPFSVPPDAVRGTQVVVSTYDVSRGQFAGGQVASQSQRGTNRVFGTMSYRLQAPQLQGGYGGSVGGQGEYSMNEVSVGLGGPIRRDKAFWFLSLAGNRRVDYPTALSAVPAGTAGSSFGVSSDSLTRFLGIAGATYGVPTDTGAYRRPGNAISALARLDVNIGTSVLFVRGHNTWYRLDRTRIGAFDLQQNGGETGARSAGAFVGLTSQFAGRFLNEARVQYTYEGRPSLRTLDLPQSSVRVTSLYPDGSSSIATLNLGGERTLPTAQDEHRVEATDELSFIWRETHRLKAGLYLNVSSFTQSPSGNRLGTFTFNSLADFQNRTPASYTRTLNAGETTGAAYNLAAWLGDAWRPTPRMQLVYGVRWEFDGFLDPPAYNAAVDAAFGFRTDRVRSKAALSPRLGFTWRLNEPREMTPEEMIRQFAAAFGRGGMGFGAPAPQAPARPGQPAPPSFQTMTEQQRQLFLDSMLIVMRADTALYNRMRQLALRVSEQQTVRTLRGGIGYFRGPAPLGLYAGSLNNTGLPGSEEILNCVGASVPMPDYAQYAASTASIPSACSGPPTPLPQRAPQVAVFGPSFSAPTTLRATLGIQAPVNRWVQANVDLLGSWGSRLYVARDVNLDATPRFTIAGEAGRPVYAPAAAIVPQTGEVPLAASRVDSTFGNVLVLESTGRSWNTSASGRLTGRFGRLTLSANYTLAWNDDENSFSCCSALQGFAAPTTAGDPNRLERSPSSNDRRHTMSFIGGLPVGWGFTMSLVTTLSSGGAYTPIVAGDINGDGVRNDRAFVHDPATTADPALAAAMTQLLGTVSGAARTCLVSQLGTVAGRNSCRSPWFTTVNLQLTGRPRAAMLRQRMEVSLAFLNLLGGMDRLLHGDEVKGWGATNQIFGYEPLLYVRGFDAAGQRYTYEVNQAFGRPRWLQFGGLNPFQLQLTVRYQLGSFGFPGAGAPGGGQGGDIRR